VPSIFGEIDGHQMRVCVTNMTKRSRLDSTRTQNKPRTHSTWIGILVFVACSWLGCTVQVDATDYISYCSPGYERCGSLGIETCVEDGTAFQITLLCAENEQCVDLKCISGEELAEATGKKPEPDGGPSVSDTVDAGHTTPFVPPPGKLGNELKMRVHLQIAEALSGSYVDIGLCPGATAASIPNEHPICAGGLFFRIAQNDTALEAMLYRHQTDSNRLVPLLSEPFPMSLEDVYRVSFEDYKEEDLAEDLIRISLVLSGLFSKESVYHSELLSRTDVGVFGLWNFESEETNEESLEGLVSSFSLSIHGSEEMTLFDFFTTSSETGGFAQNLPNDSVLGFYVTNSVASGMQISLQEL
jgi:hypothetical protein